MARNGRGAWMMFAALAVMVIGLTGVFATYATPLPLERAMAREAALDAVAADPSLAASLGTRESLGDSAPALAGPAEGLPQRIAAERVAMRRRFAEEAAAVATRLRWLICMVTLMGGLFVVLIVGGLARPR
jgi:hypothetical protein